MCAVSALRPPGRFRNGRRGQSPAPRSIYEIPVFRARCRWTALESKHIWNFGGAYGDTLVDGGKAILNEVPAFDDSFLHDGRGSRRSVSGSRAGVCFAGFLSTSSFGQTMPM
jgi:hypothetical protein